MITRVYRGSTPYGLVRYLFGKGRHEEHTDQHVVASWDGAPQELNPHEGAESDQVNRLVHLLEQPVFARAQPMKKDFVYHLVLRNDPDDRRLTDSEWAEVCTEMMDRTGIAPKGDPAGCRWIAVRHADDHVHLVATLVREDGRLPRIAPRHRGRDFSALAEVAREFEDEFGLRSLRGRDDNTAAIRPGRQEQAAATKAAQPRTPRDTLRRKVKAAAVRTAGFSEFQELLGREGVTVWPRMSEHNPDQITGYSVSLDDYLNGAGEPVRFGGGKLAPDLSWPKLAARWATGGTGPEPGTEPTAGRQPGEQESGQPFSIPEPRFNDDQEQVWREAERIVREAADRITAQAANNPEQANDAAWAATDALAAAAAGLEGDAGGPLTDAAEAFDRAGRDSFRRVPIRTDTGQALRGVGRMVGIVAASTRHPMAHAAVLSVAMSSLVSAVADLRTAQQRQHQAEAALVTAAALRQVVPAALQPAGPAAAGTAPVQTTPPAPGRAGAERPANDVSPTQSAGPPSAADIARRSVGTGFKLTRPKPATPGRTEQDLPTRQQSRDRGPQQGR